MGRARRIRCLAAGALALAVLPAAAAAQTPSAPVVTPWPGWLMHPYTLQWQPYAFPALSLGQRIDYQVVDPATGTVLATGTAPPTATVSRSFIVTPPPSGREIAGRFRAAWIGCEQPGPPGTPCDRWASVETQTPWGETRARVDSEAPSGRVRVEDDARYVNTPDIRVLLSSTDPDPGAGPGWVQLGSRLPYTCPAPGAADPTCPFPYTTVPVPYRLPDGPDGLTYVFAAWRDAAVPFGAPAGTFPGNDGNIAFTRVFLDRVPPTAVPQVASVRIARQGGWQVDYTGAASFDDDGDPANDSGVGAYEWTGASSTDARGLSSATAVAIHPEPGVYTATLRVRDLAGNWSAPVTVTAYAGVDPPAPPAPGPPAGGGAGLTPAPAPVPGVVALRLTSVKVPALRARRPAVVRLATTRRGRVTLTLAPLLSGGRAARPVVRRTRAGEPAGVAMRVTAPARPGRYRMVVSAGAHRVVRVVVVRA